MARRFTRSAVVVLHAEVVGIVAKMARGAAVNFMVDIFDFV